MAQRHGGRGVVVRTVAEQEARQACRALVVALHMIAIFWIALNLTCYDSRFFLRNSRRYGFKTRCFCTCKCAGRDVRRGDGPAPDSRGSNSPG